MTNPGDEQWQVRFSGNVQGVGFRYTTHRVAANFRVLGQVRNLGNGAVELIAEGDATELERFVEAIGQRMQGKIHEVTVDRRPASGQFSSFEIRY